MLWFSLGLNVFLMARVIYNIVVGVALFVRSVLGYVVVRLDKARRDLCFWKDYEPKYKPECMRAGSLLVDASLPKFQCAIFANARIGAPFQLIGHGCRIGDRLVTAEHLFNNEVEELRLVRGDVSIPVSKEAFVMLGNDVAYMNLTKEFQLLGLAKAKTRSVGSGRFDEAFVTVVGGWPMKATMGSLKANRGFGFLTYSGSTLEGFSGAPYFQGTTVYGMHLGGGDQNIGADITFVTALIESSLESPNLFLDHSMRRGARVKRFDDKFMALTDKGYKPISSQVYEELVAQVGLDWGALTEAAEVYREESKQIMYADDASDSENSSRAPSEVGARVSVCDPQEFAILQAENRAVLDRNMQSQLEMDSLKQMISQLQEQLTKLQESTPVQPKEALPTTAKSDLTQKRRRQRQARALKRKQERELQNCSPDPISAPMTGPTSKEILRPVSGILTQNPPRVFVNYQNSVRPLDKSLGGTVWDLRTKRD